MSINLPSIYLNKLKELFALKSHTHSEYDGYGSRISSIENLFNSLTSIPGSPTITVNHGTNSYGWNGLVEDDTTTQYNRSATSNSSDAKVYGNVTIFIPRVALTAIDKSGGTYTIGTWDASVSARGCETLTISTSSSTKISAKEKTISDILLNGTNTSLTFEANTETQWSKSTSGAGGDKSSHYTQICGKMTEDGFYIYLRADSYGEEDDYASMAYSAPKSISVTFKS